MVVPAGGPVDGGTNLTISGGGFAFGGLGEGGAAGSADAEAVFSTARLRCLFDARGALRGPGGALAQHAQSAVFGRAELAKPASSLGHLWLWAAHAHALWTSHSATQRALRG